MNELTAGPLDYHLGVLKQREKALGTSGKASSGPGGIWITGIPRPQETFGGAPRGWPGRPSQVGAGAWTPQRGRSPSCGRWLQAHPTPYPHPGTSLSPRGAFRCPERPLRARFLPPFCGGSGTQFRGRPRTHRGPCVPSKAGPSRRAAGGGRGSCMAAESPLPSQPARPGVARPRPPGAWAHAPQGPAPSCREPGPAARTGRSRRAPA